MSHRGSSTYPIRINSPDLHSKMCPLPQIVNLLSFCYWLKSMELIITQCRLGSYDFDNYRFLKFCKLISFPLLINDKLLLHKFSISFNENCIIKHDSWENDENLTTKFNWFDFYYFNWYKDSCDTSFSYFFQINLQIYKKWEKQNFKFSLIYMIWLLYFKTTKI